MSEADLCLMSQYDSRFRCKFEFVRRMDVMDDGRLFLVAVMVFRKVNQSKESHYLNLAKIKYA